MGFLNRGKDKSKSLWDQFFKAALKNEWQRALDLSTQIKQLEPDNPQVYLKTGDLLQRSGDARGAVAAYHNAADCLIREGNPQKAIAIFKVILRIDKEDQKALKLSRDIMEGRLTLAAADAAASLPDEYTDTEGIELAGAFEDEEGDAMDIDSGGQYTDEPAVNPEAELSAAPKASGADMEDLLSDMMITPAPAESAPALDDLSAPSLSLDDTEDMDELSPAASPPASTDDLDALLGVTYADESPQSPAFDALDTVSDMETLDEPDADPFEDSSSTDLPTGSPTMDMAAFLTAANEGESEDDDEAAEKAKLASRKEAVPVDSDLLETVSVMDMPGDTASVSDDPFADPPTPAPATPPVNKKPKPAVMSRMDVLRKNPILSALDTREFQPGEHRLNFNPLEVVLHEDAPGDSMYVILEGRATVVTTLFGKTIELATLQPGDFFGEVAFLTGKPRTATIIAETQLEVVELSRSVLQKTIDSNPLLLDTLAEVYRTRAEMTVKLVRQKAKG